MQKDLAIDYDHALNAHSLDGPQQVFSKLVPGFLPSSVLDVGCGTGTWLCAATERGVKDVLGVDGIDIPDDRLLIPRERFLVHDLRRPLDLGRRFDVVICLEVAEHFESKYANTLLKTLTLHSDLVIFSAAAPGQPGQNHVNCQPPEWWQQRFNALEYTCNDEVRWRLWNEARLEPWYRQNMFIASRDSALAGHEARLKTVIHPEIASLLPSLGTREGTIKQIQSGAMPMPWYLETLIRAFARKARRRFFDHNSSLPV